MLVTIGVLDRGGAGIRPDETPARNHPTVTSIAEFGSGRKLGGTFAASSILGIESMRFRVYVLRAFALRANRAESAMFPGTPTRSATSATAPSKRERRRSAPAATAKAGRSNAARMCR
jgi:hypothetical protein